MKILDKNKCLKLPLAQYDRVEDGEKLPLLISVPHGGYGVPHDLQSDLLLKYTDIFPDSDPYTRSIYAFKNEVFYYQDADIARAIVDLNRREDDLPPYNRDGVIKSHTILGTKIYRNGAQPNARKITELLRRYYYPYHQKITENLGDSDLLCGLDCHSMLEFPPGENNQNVDQRPFMCLSNNGDENGDGREDEITCPPYLLHLLADCLRQEFPEESESILLNTPFKGGHISLAHSKKIPWIQIELNRSAYLAKPWFNPTGLIIESKRLRELRSRILRSLKMFCREAENVQYSHGFINILQDEKSERLPLSYDRNS